MPKKQRGDEVDEAASEMSARATDPLGGPRSAHGLVIDTLWLYRRYSPLFLTLAAAVIVPYEALVLVATGAGPFQQGGLDFAVSIGLTVTELALVGPLVSALHLHAVREVREGGEPRLGPVARRGLRVLPVVAAVSIISWLGITAGFIVLIVPGIYLMLRWFVVAQAAAFDDEGWLPALRRGGQLTEGHYGHVFVFAIYLGMILVVPSFLVGLGFGHDSTGVASFLVGLLVQIVVYSFAALATALLYFDLRARLEAAPPRRAGFGADGRAPFRSGERPNPGEHVGEERPKGWYVDPAAPHRMRYWEGPDSRRWSTATTRTPNKIRKVWEEKADEDE